MSVDFHRPQPFYIHPINFSGAPISLNAASDGKFLLKLDFAWSKTELFDQNFDPDAVHVFAQVENLTLRPAHKDVEVTRQVAVYIKNSNTVDSDTVSALK